MHRTEVMTSAEQPPDHQIPNRREPNIHGTGKTSRSLVIWSISVLAILIGFSLFFSPVWAESVQDTYSERNLYVTGMTYDPAVFFTGDKGTVTVYVTNGNTDQSVSVNHAAFGDDNIRRISGTYDASSVIGPSQTRSYTFSVSADSNDGMYYPIFSLSCIGEPSLWHQADIQVDNTPLILIVTGKPDTFVQGRKETIDVQIANPRKNEVKNVILEISGADTVIMPSKIYIGRFESGASTTVNFTVTPDQPTTLTLDVDYNNGDNVHTVTTSLPVTFADDKKQANPVLSNVKLTIKNGIYQVTGDVTNAGLQTANGVTVAPLSPAVPQDPYQSYVIGALKPDDFGSFELTFSADGTTNVPIRLSYKDKDGNVITSQQQVSLTGAIISDADITQPGILPAIGVVVIIALACGGYLYLKKRKRQ